MNKAEYKEYLNSGKWLKFRKDFLRFYSKCEFCNKTKNLQLHHLSYKELGNENINNSKTTQWILTLCAKDHKKVHKNKALIFLDPKRNKSCKPRIPSLKLYFELKAKKPKLKKTKAR